jgi:hypothetical protein
VNPTITFGTTDGGNQVTVMKCGTMSVLCDRSFAEATDGVVWDMHDDGVVYGCFPRGSIVERTMHSVVMELAGVDVPPDAEIDHIDLMKTDNRRENLRVIYRRK